VLGDRGGRVAPGLDSLAQRQVVEATEQLERAVPALIGENLGDNWVAGKPAADVRIQLGAGPLTLLRLVKEDPLELG
jgi:hypothetical protein